MEHALCAFIVMVMVMVDLLNVEFVMDKEVNGSSPSELLVINPCFAAMGSVVSRDSENGPRASARGLRELQSSEASVLSRHPSSKWPYSTLRGPSSLGQFGTFSCPYFPRGS